MSEMQLEGRQLQIGDELLGGWLGSRSSEPIRWRVVDVELFCFTAERHSGGYKTRFVAEDLAAGLFRRAA